MYYKCEKKSLNYEIKFSNYLFLSELWGKMLELQEKKSELCDKNSELREENCKNCEM